jgi:hypothetical protein
MTPAEDFVTHFFATVHISDDDLLALCDHDPALGAGIVCRPCAAPAKRLHLQSVHTIGQFDEPGGAWKK